MGDRIRQLYTSMIGVESLENLSRPHKYKGQNSRCSAPSLLVAKVFKHIPKVQRTDTIEIWMNKQLIVPVRCTFCQKKTIIATNRDGALHLQNYLNKIWILLKLKSIRYVKSLFLLLFLCLLNVNLFAHEIRPAYLEITQVQSDQYNILWKIPMKGNASPKISPVFPVNFILKKEQNEILPTAYLKKYSAHYSGNIHGQNVSIQGLETTLIDVLVQVKLLDQTSYTILLQADRPEWTIPFEPNSWQVVQTYLVLGVEHILGGFDHLLFVLGLLLIVSGFKNLIKTVTVFTVAHSITLALSVLGWVSLPSAPVEAVIALSIVLLAKEYLDMQAGKTSWTIQYPWAVAFVFGLLHGFGFAGALQEVGLPQVDIPLALLMFNLGVEMGQLCFIALVLLALFFYKKMKWPVWNGLPKFVAYGMGGIAVFWLIERLLEF